MTTKSTVEGGMQEPGSRVRTTASGELPLEDSFKAYERAVELRDRLNAILDESDKRIRVLTEGGEAPLDPEEGEDA